MNNKDRILKTLSELKPELKPRYKVKEIGVFGSFVRGEQTEASDVDILVELEEPIGFFKFLELEEYLASRLGLKVDLVSKKALKPTIGRYILEEVVMA
jgi:predicted nucleotidyltransferase